ncbi:hypothetical protein ES703_14593 [subsurface metagenome]
MVMEGDPRQFLEDIVRTGLETFKSTVEGITTVLRTGDSAIRDLDGALTGVPAPHGETSEQTFVEVMALMQGAMQEAREHGAATADAVVQRARQILGRVSQAEPAWRPGPSIVRSANDMIRVALRDLRASNNLLKLAQGQGSLDDLEGLTKWADDFSERIGITREVVAQPKRSGQAPAPATVQEVPAPTPQAPTTTLPPVVTATKPKRKKRDTTPKTKGNPQDTAFAKAVAEEMGDLKIKQWAQDFADGKISEKQWVSRLTNHAAAGYDNLEDIFARATERMARESSGQ